MIIVVMSIVNIHLTVDRIADYTTLSVHSFLASVCKNRPQQVINRAWDEAAHHHSFYSC